MTLLLTGSFAPVQTAALPCRKPATRVCAFVVSEHEPLLCAAAHEGTPAAASKDSITAARTPCESASRLVPSWIPAGCAFRACSGTTAHMTHATEAVETGRLVQWLAQDSL